MSYVYFIQQGEAGPVKIGYSLNPLRRLSDLQSGNPEKLHLRAIFPGGAALERTLHRYFEECRQLNEWFEPTAELLDLMDDPSELNVWSVS